MPEPEKPSLSLVLVTYHSSAVLAAACASFRREAAAAGLTAEIVVVDHSQSREELERISGAGADTVLARENRGYAAGINAGMAASRGDLLLVGNPDIAFAPGSLQALLDALAGGWDIAGPQLTLGPFLLPPADLQTPAELWGRYLAGVSAPLWRRHLGRETRRWLRAWCATETVAVRALSGALLAFRREVAQVLGPWDEGYFLYFEETDWLRRAARYGLSVGLVPAARVLHLWGHAADPVRYQGEFARSQQRFFRRHHALAGRWRPRQSAARFRSRVAPLPAGAAGLPQGELVWLVSPSPLGVPAAGLIGSAELLASSLAGVIGQRKDRLSYFVVAYDPRRKAIAGDWKWTPKDG